MTSLQKVLTKAAALLTPQSSSARLDAELLLQHVLAVSRTFLYTHPENPIHPFEIDRYNALINARIQGMPIAYLLGYREFWSLPLHVNQHTLIPRPETELLVELALKSLPQKKVTVLDLGTGSGAIALALAKERPLWHILATDNNSNALEIARYNATSLHLSNLHFLLSDWFEAIPMQRFDAIISNPPYIATDDPHLRQGDLCFEPLHALASGIDGLHALRHIIKTAPAYLATGGLLLLEHGFQQKAAVVNLLHQSHYQTICTWQDIAGLDRVSGGKQ